MATREQGDQSPRARLTGRGVYPVEYAHWLMNPLRRLICPAGMIARRLQLRPSDHVLEVGPGPGYFSPTVAARLTAGRLTLFDLQPGMLALARERLARRGCTNVSFECGHAASLPFANEAFDVVFLVTVLGEVDDRAAALRECARVLTPGGRLSVTEMFGDPDFVRVPDLARETAEAGFTLERRYGPRFYYTCNFLKVGSGSEQE